MAKLLFPLIAMLIFMASAYTPNKPLHRGRTKGITEKAQDLARSVATTIRNLKIVSPREKEELLIMANEFVYQVHSISYTITLAVSSLQNEEYRFKLQALILNFEENIHEVQHCIYEDIPKLQEKLASALEGFAPLFEKGFAIVVQYHGDNETFMSNQLRECSDIMVFALYKLHFHGLFFTKTNKELDGEFSTGFDRFKSTLDRLKVDDEDTRNELLYLVQYLGQLCNNAIFKLQHWLSINHSKDESYTIVKGTADSLSELYHRLHVLNVSNHGVFDIVKQLKDIFFSGAGKIKLLTNAEGTLGGQEFVRNVLYDSLSVTTSFSVELDIFLEKKNTHSFH